MTKANWIPAAVAVLACSICVAVAQQPTPLGKIPNAVEEPLNPPGPSSPTANNAQIGRYQAFSLGDGSRIVLVDTHTGQCWSRYLHMKTWQDLGSPVGDAK